MKFRDRNFNEMLDPFYRHLDQEINISNRLIHHGNLGQFSDPKIQKSPGKRKHKSPNFLQEFQIGKSKVKNYNVTLTDLQTDYRVIYRSIRMEIYETGVTRKSLEIVVMMVI
jgi:hypothetical protein